MTASVPPPATTVTLNNGPIAIVGPLTLMEILDRTFRVLRARFGILTLSAAIILVPIGILSTIFMGRFMTGYFEFIEAAINTPSATPNMAEFIPNMASYLGIVFLLSILSMVGTAIISLMSIFHVDRFLHGQESTFGEGWSASLRRLLPYIGMSLLQALIMGLITIGVMLVIVLIFVVLVFIFGGAMATMGDSAGGALVGVGLLIVFLILYFISLLFIFAPSIYLSGRWAAAAPSLLIEEQGPVDSLKRSWALTATKKWRSILFVVLLYLLNFVVIGLPVGIVQMITQIAMPTQLAVVTIITSVISYAVAIVTQPFLAAGAVLYYYDARVRNEAYDVALRVSALEAEIAPDAPTS